MTQLKRPSVVRLAGQSKAVEKQARDFVHTILNADPDNQGPGRFVVFEPVEHNPLSLRMNAHGLCVRLIFEHALFAASSDDKAELAGRFKMILEDNSYALGAQLGEVILVQPNHVWFPNAITFEMDPDDTATARGNVKGELAMAMLTAVQATLSVVTFPQASKPGV